MKLASLFSGGKDSMYATYLAQKQGHEVTCLLSIFAHSDESHLLHHPNLQWTKLQSTSMNIPQLTLDSTSDNIDEELVVLENLLRSAKEKFEIEGLVHGGIKSKFQKEKFESICLKLDLISISPLWDTEPEQYMNDLIDSGVSRTSKTRSAEANPFCSSTLTLLRLRIGPRTLNKIKIKRIKSSEFIFCATRTSCPPIHNKQTPINAPIISIIGEEIRRSFALLNIN